jgi:hypothetical protein
MNTSSSHWLPAGPGLTLGQRWALAVPLSSTPMTKARHRVALEVKLDSLARLLSPQDLQAVLEMSVEHLPELYSLAQEGLPPHQLGAALMETDGLMMLLNRIDWELEGATRPSREQSLREILEQF